MKPFGLRRPGVEETNLSEDLGSGMLRQAITAFGRMLNAISIWRWRRAARSAGDMNTASLRSLRRDARRLRMQLDRVLHVADGRLTLPLMGSNAIRRPLFTDWVYRPELWRSPLAQRGLSAVQTDTKLGNEITIFHDSSYSEITVRQIRNTREADLAPFGLAMDVFGFDGTFLSLVIDLPKSGVNDLQLKHLLRLSTVVEMEKPLKIFARLNVKHGPNTEQIVRELPLYEKDVMVEFDLAYTQINEKRVERMWVELLFDNPEMSQVIVRDINFCRRPRAEV